MHKKNDDEIIKKIKKHEIFIDPSYKVFNSNRLFDLDNSLLNRDGQLLPFHRMREHMRNNGIDVNTADRPFKNSDRISRSRDYYSFGLLKNFERIHRDGSARLAAFIIMEPPVVAPALYSALPRLTEVFDRVYVHNTIGDGYSLDNVNISKLHKLYWPIPYCDVIESSWINSPRMKRIVVINGSHNPRRRKREQYSLRIKAMAELSKINMIDLYGLGWEKWWSPKAMWLPYWLNRKAIMSIYKGSCESKFDTLKNYEFCLCFENMAMNGYITEKLFDCLYAGTIPLYIGAPDILDYIPANVFIDCRNYSSWTEMWRDVSARTPAQLTDMRNAGRNFLKSEIVKNFYFSIEHICEN